MLFHTTLQNNDDDDDIAVVADHRTDSVKPPCTSSPSSTTSAEATVLPPGLEKNGTYLSIDPTTMHRWRSSTTSDIATTTTTIVELYISTLLECLSRQYQYPSNSSSISSSTTTTHHNKSKITDVYLSMDIFRSEDDDDTVVVVRSDNNDVMFNDDDDRSFIINNNSNNHDHHHSTDEARDDDSIHSTTSTSTRNSSAAATLQACTIVSDQHLRLQKLRHRLLQGIVQYLPHLRSLRLYSSESCCDADNDYKDTDNMLTSVSPNELARILVHAPQLQTLIVTRCLYLLDNNSVTSCGGCPSLEQALYQHKSLRQIKLLDVHIIEQQQQLSYNSLDPLILALSSISQLESVDITLRTFTPPSLHMQQHPQQSGNNYNDLTSSQELRDGVSSRPTTTVQQRRRSTAHRRHHMSLPQEQNVTTTKTRYGGDSVQHQPQLISPSVLYTLLEQCRQLTDVSLWECQLHNEHLWAIRSALLSSSRSSLSSSSSRSLQFLSLRCNPNITSDAWCTFYRTTLPYCYTLMALYNDHMISSTDDLWMSLSTSSSSYSQTNNLVSTAQESSRTSPENITNTVPNVSTTPQASSSARFNNSDRHDDARKMVNDEEQAMALAAMYLTLNRCGRNELYNYDDYYYLDTTTNVNHQEEAWFNLLYRFSDTPAALYALISHHPTAFLRP